MGVIGFHKFLISAAILFCLGYAIWELLQYSQGAGAASLIISVIFLVLAAGLGYYLANLARFLHRDGP